MASADDQGKASAWERDLRYHAGFGNHVLSEAIEGAVPRDQNSPQHTPYGLFAEQLSGTGFTAPRAVNQRTWLYRLSPSVAQGAHRPVQQPRLVSDFTTGATSAAADQLRWRPPGKPEQPTDFVNGLSTLCGAGSAAAKQGLAIHLYACDAPMLAADRAFLDTDGDLLLVPQQGALRLTTELGRLHVPPGHVAVVPRGVAFAADPECEAGGYCRGYVLEVFEDAHFRLPELGPIGANGLAEPHHFEAPHAWFEDRRCEFTVVAKVCGDLFARAGPFSPFDVAGWHGNYVPYRYDLSRFHPVNTVGVDHPDPSVFTVLTVPGAAPGAPPCVDLAIFPPRWLCAEASFRPPYFHRNCVAEFMGLVRGAYDAKEGFCPGASSLHGVGTPHGPDAATYAAALAEDTSVPRKFDKGLAFMFESRLPLKLAPFAAEGGLLDGDYRACWEGIPRATVPAPAGS